MSIILSRKFLSVCGHLKRFTNVLERRATAEVPKGIPSFLVTLLTISKIPLIESVCSM